MEQTYLPLLEMNISEDGALDMYSDNQNRKLAEKYNEGMRNAAMPVTVIVGIEVVLGFFGNLAVLYVFLFRYHKCNFRYFVLCLALTDITSTLTTMSGEMVTQLYWFIYPYPILCKIKSFFNVFTVCSEALCLLIIAVDRYRKVCTPFEWQIKPVVAKCLCVALYLVALAVSVPVAIFWGTHDEVIHYELENVTVTVCEIDHKYKYSDKPVIYSYCLEAFLCVSLLLMFGLYVLIARKIFFKRNRFDSYARPRENTEGPRQNDAPASDVESSQDNNGASLSRHEAPTRRNILESKMKRKTLIMFILTVTFIVTTVIYTTMLSFIANDALRHLSDSKRAVYFFFFRLYFINHVINPVVYGVLDPTFRKTMMNCRASGGPRRASDR